MKKSVFFIVGLLTIFSYSLSATTITPQANYQSVLLNNEQASYQATPLRSTSSLRMKYYITSSVNVPFSTNPAFLYDVSSASSAGLQEHISSSFSSHITAIGASVPYGEDGASITKRRVSPEKPPQDPFPNPLTDGVWLLMMMAVCYVMYRIYPKKSV